MNSIDVKDKWFLDRHGRFTASEIGKLLIGKNGEMFGQGAKTYIRQKAIESMTVLHERPEVEEVKSLLHGKAHEWPAFEFYMKATGNKSMRYFGTEEPLFLNYNEDSGGSPDGIMGEGEVIKWGLELKCPKNSHIHFDHYQFKDQYDLRQYNLDNYAQVQFLLMITKADGFHWCSFDDRFRSPKMKMKLIDVLPDRQLQDNLEIRLQMAIKEKKTIVSQYQ